LHESEVQVDSIGRGSQLERNRGAKMKKERLAGGGERTTKGMHLNARGDRKMEVLTVGSRRSILRLPAKKKGKTEDDRNRQTNSILRRSSMGGRHWSSDCVARF